MNALKTTQLLAKLINKKTPSDIITEEIKAAGGEFYRHEIHEALDGLTQKVKVAEIEWKNINNLAIYTSNPYRVINNGVPIIKVAQLSTL